MCVETFEKPRRRPQGRERGQALVEFALVLPLFTLMVMAIIDFGWAFRTYVTITNAAREGARYGVTCKTADQIKDRTVDYSSNILTTADVTVTFPPTAQNPCEGATTLGEPVTVKVDYDYTYITPVGGLMSMVSGGALPSPLRLSSTTKMRIE
jgi:Flp pilus assembly protein TadG